MTASNVITGVDEMQTRRLRAMQSFGFTHRLAFNPLLSQDSIKHIVRSLLDQGRSDQVFYTMAGKEVESVPEEQRRKNVLEMLDTLGSANTWLRLTRINEVRPEFQGIVDQFYQDLTQLYGFEIQPRVYKTLVTLFVSSPGAIAPYHFDHTWNFLLQISGRKTVHLFDPNDPSVLSQRAKEQFYAGGKGDWLKREPAAGSGIPFELEPGMGVHHPVNAPHWVENGPEISISLSLGLCLHESNRAAKIHQLNSLLRRLGLQPLPPGESKYRDLMKVQCMNLFSDRHPESFDDIVFSGWRRLVRLKQGRIFSK